MRDNVRYILLFLVSVIFFALLGWSLGWFNLITSRPMTKYQEETRAQTYDTSRQYQQGTNRDIARYCEQMRRETSDSGKKAVAALIRSTSATYEGPLTPDNQDCLMEAKGL